MPLGLLSRKALPGTKKNIFRDHCAFMDNINFYIEEKTESVTFTLEGDETLVFEVTEHIEPVSFSLADVVLIENPVLLKIRPNLTSLHPFSLVNIIEPSACTYSASSCFTGSSILVGACLPTRAPYKSVRRYTWAALTRTFMKD
ncbi:MAG: hypothetical protein ABS67_01865 [Niabella sp. SCN 42-15]|nr:MAG: hypothetical protein ABS67_01865 [Niabella sp. SCN 42-15]